MILLHVAALKRKIVKLNLQSITSSVKVITQGKIMKWVFRLIAHYDLC